MMLIEKLERESDRLHKLSVDFSHDTRLRLINEALGIYRAIDIVKKHQGESVWVSVDERLPDKDGEYLVFIRNEFLGYQFVALFTTDTGVRWSISDVTHWMPLPQPPK
nr:hypothetical protein 3 [Moraxellaceae bacterium]